MLILSRIVSPLLTIVFAGIDVPTGQAVCVTMAVELPSVEHPFNS